MWAAEAAGELGDEDDEAAWIRMSDRLIQLIEDAPVVDGR
jgi:hypothetical protein